MKKIYLLILALTCFHFVKATNPVPNSSFENWTTGSPDNWTANNVQGVYTPITQVSPGNSGSYAAKGQVTIYLTDTLPPVLSAEGSGYGFAITQAYDNLEYHYKSNLTGGDWLYAIVYIYDASYDIIGLGIDTISANASGFTDRNVPIIYSGGTDAATAVIEFLIGPGGSGSTVHSGSYFILDDVSLSGVTGINNITGNLGSYSLFPNPVSDNLNLDVNLTENNKVEVQLFNSLGAEVSASDMYEGKPGDNRYKIDVQHLPQGIYFARILMDGVLSSTRQFMVSR